MNEKQHCRILIIEDDQDIVSTMRMILEHKGYAVFNLKNSVGMIELMKCNHINIVIIDMFLSEANGTYVCNELKNDASLCHIPVIMMSGYPDAESMCKKAGANDFVYKPFDLDELLFKVGKHTGAVPVPE